MNATVRVLVPVLATLSTSQAFSDVRPVPSPGNGPVVVPAPGHGPGRGPGFPQPHPGPGYPQPYPEQEAFHCRELNGGYDFINITPSQQGRAEYRAEMNALGIYGTHLRAFVSNRINDSMLLQIQTPYGTAHMTIGYLNHPYGPTAVFSFGGSYEEFRCVRTTRPTPPPHRNPYPPYPYPSSPYPIPHR